MVYYTTLPWYMPEFTFPAGHYPPLGTETFPRTNDATVNIETSLEQTYHN